MGSVSAWNGLSPEPATGLFGFGLRVSDFSYPRLVHWKQRSYCAYLSSLRLLSSSRCCGFIERHLKRFLALVLGHGGHGRGGKLDDGRAGVLGDDGSSAKFTSSSSAAEPEWCRWPQWQALLLRALNEWHHVVTLLSLSSFLSCLFDWRYCR